VCLEAEACQFNRSFEWANVDILGIAFLLGTHWAVDNVCPLGQFDQPLIKIEKRYVASLAACQPNSS
jgi:hypothetical protein